MVLIGTAALREVPSRRIGHRMLLLTSGLRRLRLGPLFVGLLPRLLVPMQIRMGMEVSDYVSLF